MLRSVSLLVLCILIIFSASSQPGSSTLFTVAKKPVTAEEFIYLYKKNHQHKPEEFTKEKIEEYLNLYINFKLKVTEAQKRGIDTTQAFQKEFNSYKEDLRKPYLPDAKLVDSLVQLTYNRMKEEINASHILVNLKPNATPADTLVAYNRVVELRNRALNGEDFGSLAANYSEDPSAKGNKGNLGYFTALQMVYPFETAAYNTAVGQISMPVRTSFGYHIIKVNDRRPARGEVEVAHIMIRTGDNADNERSKNKIFEIYDELQKGVSWDELCREHSEDPASKENGGKLRPFGVGVMASVPQFEKVAFELETPGQISDPFETQYGWHILRLERKIPLQTLEEVSSSLKNRVSRDERVQVSKQALYNKLRRNYSFTEHSDIKAKTFALADSSLTKGKFTAKEMNATSPLFSLGGTSYSQKDFLEYVKQTQKPTRLAPVQYMDQLYNAFIESKLLATFEKDIIEKSPDYKWLLKEYYEGILLFDIMEKEVWNKASEDSIGQVNYFKANSKKYQAQDRAKAHIYSSTTREHLDQLQQVIENNDSTKTAELISKYKIRVEKGQFEQKDRIVLSKVAWATGNYQVQNNNLYYLVSIERILPPGQKTFEEARPEVISDYQTYLEQNWIASLKKKYPVKVNKKIKSFAVEQLINTAPLPQ